MALEVLRRLRWIWPSAKKEQLRQLASTWDVLWSANRRRALAKVFEAMTWRARTRRLIVKLRAEMP